MRYAGCCDFLTKKNDKLGATHAPARINASG